MVGQGLADLDALDPVIAGGKRIDLNNQLVLQDIDLTVNQ